MQKKETCKTFHSKDISIFQSCLCFAGLLMIPLCRAYPCKADLLVNFHIRSRQIQSINKLLDTVVAFRGLRRLRVSCRHDVRLFLNVLSFLLLFYFILISISVTIFRAYALFYVPIVLKNLAYYLTHFLPLLYRGLQFLIFNTVLDSLNDMIIIFYCL